MSIGKQAVEGIFWTALQSWGSKAVSLVTFAVLARLLSPEAFGIIALGKAFVAFAKVLIEKGFTDAIVQRENLDDLHVQSAFWANLGVGIILMLITWVMSPWIAQFFDEPDLEPVLHWLSLIFGVRALNGIQEALFRRDVEFKVLSIAGFLGVCVGGGFGITMAYQGYGVWSLVAHQIASQATNVTILWVVSNWRPSFMFSLSHVRDLLSFGVGTIGSGVLSFVNRRMDDLLIGAFLGSTALGYYNIAYRILLAFTQLISRVGAKVMFPVFSQLQTESEKLRETYYTAVNYLSIISVPVFIGLAVLAPYVIPVVFGAKWSASVPVMQILSFAGLLQSLIYFNSPVMNAKGHSLINMSLSTLRAVVNFTAFMIAVQWGGIVTVAALYTIAGYCIAPVELWVVRKLTGIEWKKYFGAMAYSFVATVISAICVLATTNAIDAHAPVIGVLIVGCLTGMMVFVGVILLLRPTLVNDVRNLWRLAMFDTK
ncbi:MOP flippase family protein [Salinibacter sp.]|uniref:MOP flippase family protein n=1 Tax=Salinibacter sp. TaxID=2065818 RepID=UPI0021E76F42|nr:MOP flippase family protein [Salinibacter sp.]